MQFDHLSRQDLLLRQRKRRLEKAQALLRNHTLKYKKKLNSLYPGPRSNGPLVIKTSQSGNYRGVGYRGTWDLQISNHKAGFSRYERQSTFVGRGWKFFLFSYLSEYLSKAQVVIEKANGPELAHEHSVPTLSLPSYKNGKDGDIFNWLLENMSRPCWIGFERNVNFAIAGKDSTDASSITVKFMKASDAVMFKLRFGGHA